MADKCVAQDVPIFWKLAVAPVVGSAMLLPGSKVSPERDLYQNRRDEQPVAYSHVSAMSGTSKLARRTGLFLFQPSILSRSTVPAATAATYCSVHCSTFFETCCDLTPARKRPHNCRPPWSDLLTQKYWNQTLFNSAYDCGALTMTIRLMS